MLQMNAGNSSLLYTHTGFVVGDGQGWVYENFQSPKIWNGNVTMRSQNL